MFNGKNHPILNASPLAERTLSPASATLSPASAYPFPRVSDPFPRVSGPFPQQGRGGGAGERLGEMAEPERG